jgi:hypothetical protein
MHNCDDDFELDPTYIRFYQIELSLSEKKNIGVDIYFIFFVKKGDKAPVV